MTFPDPDVVAKKVIELYGGRENLLQTTEQHRSVYEAAWDQDAEQMGRVLRAHLVVEHFLTRHIESAHPGLGSLERVRLTFAQKIDLLGDDDKIAKFLEPGLRRLNQIRNRLAHKLSMDLTGDDRASFLAIGIYNAMRHEREKRSGLLSIVPLSVLEDFARFAAHMLQPLPAWEREIWSQAMRPVEAVTDSGG